MSLWLKDHFFFIALALVKFQVFNTCSRFMLAFTILLTYNENLYTDWKVFHMQWYWGSTSGSTDAFPDVQWVSTQRTLPLLCIYLIFLWCFCWIALSACGLLFNIIEKGDPYGCMLVQTNYHFRLLPETFITNYLKSLGS